MAEQAAVKKQAGSQTRALLLATATRLFAAKGLDGVSLAEINRAAGQRNATALHYHFGGKEELVQAVFDKHTPRVNKLRQNLLSDLPAVPTLDEVVALLIVPLAEQVKDTDGGTDYLQFLGQVNTAPGVDRAALDKRGDRVLDAQQQQFQQILATLPAEQRQLRAEFMILMVFGALAGYASEVQSRGYDEQQHQLFLSQLTASAAAVLAQ